MKSFVRLQHQATGKEIDATYDVYETRALVACSWKFGYYTRIETDRLFQLKSEIIQQIKYEHERFWQAEKDHYSGSDDTSGDGSSSERARAAGVLWEWVAAAMVAQRRRLRMH
jgi:hypothetical protein